MGVGERVHRQPLRRGADSSGHADAGHEDIRLVLALLAPLGAHIAIVLGVDAVELRQLGALLRYRARGRVLEVAQDMAPQVIALRLELLVLVERLRLCLRGVAHGWAPAPSASMSAPERYSIAIGCEPTSSVKWQRSDGERACAARAIPARSPPGPACRPGDRKSGATRTSP